MPLDYPLCFEPVFRRYLWGGQRLGTLLGKPIGNETCAESWEVVDRGEDQSIVTNGPAAGKTLSEIIRSHGRELFGMQLVPRRFPLLFKFLDAHQRLSVQVHPNDTQAAQLEPPDLGKTEAWVVLAAEPGSRIFAGLNAGCDRTAFECEIGSGTCEQCLNAFEPACGDCIFIPAGTVHALGEGLLVAEIQQASDTTFRIFDWNRVGADGNPRPLHVKQALDVIDFHRGPVAPATPMPTDDPDIERLVACEQFTLDRWRFSNAKPIGGADRFHLIVVLEGEVEIETTSAATTLRTGETALIPAASGKTTASPVGSGVLLDIYIR